MLSCGADPPSIVDSPVPVRSVRLEPDGMLAAALEARPGRVWLVRPDGHLAAVLDKPLDVAAALRRACGH